MTKQLIDGYKRFRDGYFAREEASLNALADRQSPHTMVISCADSRVEPSILFAAKPGELFVVRNVANIVPPAHNTDPNGVSAALMYAVTVLGVSNVLVMGHSACGGIKALVDSDGSGDTYIDHWIALASDAKAASAHELDEPYHACELHNVGHSVANLESYDFVAERVAKGELTLIGMHYDLATSELSMLDRDENIFKPL